jgi:DNA-binding MarR family transcriptional regulator
MAQFRHSEEYRIVWLIRRVFRAMGQMAEGYLQELGISAADRAIMEFIYPEEKLSVPEIAGRYNVSRQHVQVTVNRLLEANLVTTAKNPRHKRSSLILLTKEGRSLFRSIREREREVIQALFSTVRSEDRHAALKTLEAMLTQLTKEKSHV